MSEGRAVSKKWVLLAGAVVAVIAAVIGFQFATSQQESDSVLAVPENPRMLIVGDSYAEGIGAENPPADNWARLAADHYAELGWETRVDAAGGTGWINGAGGPNSYGERISRDAQDTDFVPNILVLQGGANDFQSAPADVGAAVEASIDQARELWPGVQVIVFSSSIPYGLTSQAGPLSTAIADAAAAAGAPVINPYADGWMTADTAQEYTAGDGTHLTTAGYAYVADRFIGDFSALYGLT